MEYTDSLYLMTPYKVTEQSVEVVLASQSPPHYITEKEPSGIEAEIATFGPYEETQPFTFEELRLHVENNKPVRNARARRAQSAARLASCVCAGGCTLARRGARLQRARVAQTIAASHSHCALAHLPACCAPQFFTIKNLVREYRVSHWGSLSVEDQYVDLTHTGAKLKGGWSRYEHTRAMNQYTNQVRHAAAAAAAATRRTLRPPRRAHTARACAAR